MKGKRARARMIRAEALALSAMMATMNVMPALADSGVNLEVGIEASSEGEGERDKDLASSSNATPVKEEDNIDKEIETEENEEDSGDFEFEEELENDLETEESTENLEGSESDEDTESSESGKESLEDTENESEIESSGAEESSEESSENLEESSESEEETEEVDLEQVKVATPSNLEKPEVEPEIMTLSLRGVVYGEWNTSEDKLWEIFPQEDGTCSIRPLADIVKTGSVVVPEEEDGFTVISIAESAWNNSSNLTEINMSGIKVIGNSAFYGSGLTSVTLDNVDTISDSAFRNCTGLTELNIGSVGTIESSSFAECDNLTNVNINEVSGTVKEYAFNNSGVETITIDRINNAEYNSLVAKEKITIGYAENLNGAKAKNIEITSGNNVMCGNYWPSNYAGNSNNICETITIGDVTGTVKAFAFNNITIESADNIIADADVVDIKNANTITKVNGREVNITEVNYLQNITDADYENSWRINGTHEIEKLNITHVGEIDNRCFYDNENLNTVIIESAGTIGDSAFEDCSALSDLQIGTVDKIGRMAFSGCSSLETLTTQDLGEIGESAFIITGLRTINLGNVNKIGVGAFYSLSNLETVNIGNVEEIREDAFAHNMALKTVTMGEINEMGARAFERCLELETVNWTCKLETLPERAFYYDGKLKSIDLGSDLKSVGYKALFKCNSIKELTIPAGVDTVNFVDLCGEYDYSGEADFSRGYKLTFLGDNTDFEIRYGEENVLGDNDDSIIINELILPSKESKAYKRITSVDNTDIINTIDGGRSNVVYHAVAKNTKATYKTGSININGVISNYNMLTPYSDGNMGKEVDWSWWSVYKDIGNEVGDSSNVGGQGTGRVIQHTIIPVLKIGDEIIDGSTGDKKETVTVRFWKNDGTDTLLDEQEIEKGTKDVNTSDPYLSGYWFVGWYLEPECINSATNGYGDSRIDVEDLTTDLDVYARWEKEYKIIRYLDKEDGEILKEVKEYNGESIDIDKEAPEIELGQWEDLRGWKEIRYTMKLYIINGYMISINIEEYIPEIEYIPPKEMISIVYYNNDGTDRIFHFDDIEKGKTLGLISEKPEREGYEFTGWFYEAECENKVPEIARFEKDTRLYAGWKIIETEETKPDKPSETEPTEPTEPSEETKPEETKPEETLPEESTPSETEPEETLPEETKPSDENKPSESEPEETSPSESEPEETKPDTKPNPSESEGNKEETDKPEESKPNIEESKPSDETQEDNNKPTKPDTIPTGNGSHGGGGSHSGGSSTVTVVNVHEDKPEPEKKTIDENGVPQGETDKEEVNTTTLDENGVPRDKAEKEEQDNIDSLPKTGDKRNIFIYWITFMSSLSSIMFMGLKDKMRSRTSKEKTENKIK